MEHVGGTVKVMVSGSPMFDILQIWGRGGGALMHSDDKCTACDKSIQHIHAKEDF